MGYSVTDRRDLRHRLRKVGAILRHEAARVTGRHPLLYDLFYRWRPSHRERVVDGDTDVCIEGYARSANSFAVGAFRRAQPEPVDVAHHSHRPAPVLQAVRRGVPAVVLIRDPVDAVISRRALTLQNHARSEEDGRPPTTIPYVGLLREWIDFYETLEPVRDRVVVAPFEVVTRDFGSVIEEVNERFGTDFTPFGHEPEEARAIGRDRGYHALPSEERDRLKERARRELLREMGETDALVRRAQATFHSWVN